MTVEQKARHLLSIMAKREALILCLEVISSLSIPGKIARIRGEWWQQIYNIIDNSN